MSAPTYGEQFKDRGYGVINLGSDVQIQGLRTGDAIWRHPGCRAWFHLDLTSGNYHRIVKGSLDAEGTGLTITASLLCPKCGFHGFIENDRWRAA